MCEKEPSTRSVVALVSQIIFSEQLIQELDICEQASGGGDALRTERWIPRQILTRAPKTAEEIALDDNEVQSVGGAVAPCRYRENACTSQGGFYNVLCFLLSRI